MGTRTALVHVIRSFERITGSRGTDFDKPFVDKFLKDPNGVSTDIVSRVGGILVGNFFAASTQAFSNSVSSFWQELRTQSGVDVPPMEGMGTDTTALQVAVFLDAFA